MRKEKKLDQAMVELFPHLEAVFIKNRMEFGNLLEMLNIYTLIGAEDLIAHHGEDTVKATLLKMVKGALFKIRDDWKMAALEALTLTTAIFFNIPREVGARWIEDFVHLLIGRYKLKPLPSYISHKITLAILSMAYASADQLLHVL